MAATALEHGLLTKVGLSCQAPMDAVGMVHSAKSSTKLVNEVTLMLT